MRRRKGEEFIVASTSDPRSPQSSVVSIQHEFTTTSFTMLIKRFIDYFACITQVQKLLDRSDFDFLMNVDFLDVSCYQDHTALLDFLR